MPSTISAGTSAGTALNITSDTTGNLAFQTNNGVTALTIDTSQNVTFANNVTYTGTITATAGFSGNGAGLTAINASNVSSGTLASARLPTVPVANGGTGASTLTANNVLLGNGTSAVQVVAPGTANNVLTSNGTTWISSAPTSKIINVETVTNSTRASLSSTGSTPVTLTTFTYNKQSASSSLIFIVMIPMDGDFSGTCACDLTYGSSSAFGSLYYPYTAQSFTQPMIGQATLTGYTTTGSQTLTARYYAPNGESAKPANTVNPNSSDDGRNIQQVSTVTVIEYL